mgnify:CR=1 FL=1
MSVLIDGFWQIDLYLFKLINFDSSHSVLDVLLPYLTNLHNMPFFRYGLGPLFIAVWIFFQRKRALRVLFAVAITLAVSDSFNYRILKPLIGRERPNQQLQTDSILRVYGPKSGSFPSNHAASGFAVAYTLQWYYPGLRWIFFSLATVVALSRVYAGVHFPSDILGGALIGLAIGFILKEFIFRRFNIFSSSRRR